MNHAKTHLFAHGVDLNEIGKNPQLLNAAGTGPAMNYTLLTYSQKNEPELQSEIEFDHTYFYNSDKEKEITKKLNDMVQNKTDFLIAYKVPHVRNGKMALRIEHMVYITPDTDCKDVLELNTQFINCAENFTQCFCQELQGGPSY
jgi:hypothetical protein